MNLIPTVIEKSNYGERAYDIYSRLLKDRIIILSGEIDDNLSNSIVAQLLYLDGINNDDISLYINSPGGSPSFAVVDSKNFNFCLFVYRFNRVKKLTFFCCILLYIVL